MLKCGWIILSFICLINVSNVGRHSLAGNRKAALRSVLRFVKPLDVRSPVGLRASMQSRLPDVAKARRDFATSRFGLAKWGQKIDQPPLVKPTVEYNRK
ncbi:MAG: hypothetical protein BGO32_07045 [Bacteroidetes bacterium 37-13]|nr:MAG: hypothetical protein BGO32_07045 [Bacteroidetes bacterium 37-13]